MKTTGKLRRRTFLRGVGTAVALPFLDAMLPSDLVVKAHAAGKKFPRRMAFFYVPNGIHMPAWSPAKAGALRELPELLAPLKDLRSHMLVLSGLTQDKARANGDGPGDHARSAAAFLTGSQPKKTNGKDIRVGISVDQYAAGRVGKETPFPSIEIGCDKGKQTGNCDSGYSCAYSHNLSWKSASMPMAKETSPRQLFDRLFPNIAEQKSQVNERYRKSILDFVLGDAKKLGRKLGSSDTRKLDEYLTAVREIEGRLSRAQADKEKDGTVRKLPKDAEKIGQSLPGGKPGDYGEHIRLLGDIMILAFQADLTRVATFMLANEGSNKSYKNIGVPEGHHSLSHHGNDGGKQQKIKKINRFHMDQFAYLMKKLKASREGSYSLLDNSMVLYGSGIGDGNRHNHHELPIILLGKGGGTIKPGRHVRYPKNTPLNNLYLAMLERMGAPCKKLGDSTARLSNLYSAKY